MVLKRFVVGPVVNAFFHPQVEGLENIPEAGGAILASNHLSFADSVFLPVAIDRQVYFLAKSEYFTGKGLRGRGVAAFFRGINQIPMDRSGGNRSAQSLTQAAHTVREGHLLGIYPEGTRSPDGRMYRAKLGVARLALESGVPVIPVAMINTDKVQPTGSALPRRRGKDGRRIDAVRTVIGTPLDFSRYRGQASRHAVQREVADEIMRAIQELSGQEYVDVYASSVKAVMEKQRVADAKVAVAELIEKAKARTQASVENARAGVENAKGKVSPAWDKVDGALQGARTRLEDRVNARRSTKDSAPEDSAKSAEDSGDPSPGHGPGDEDPDRPTITD